MADDKGSSIAWPHTRVRSVGGPEWCCQQCSLSVKDYVEWPCPGTQLLAFAIIGAAHKDGPAS